MTRLVLLRHAKSDWKAGFSDDRERPLNKRGKKQIPSLAAELAARGIRPDRIVASSARRALETARAMAREYGLPPEEVREDPELYLADPDTLAEKAGESLREGETLFLVAHNPGISLLASRLADRAVHMSTCCAAVADYPRGPGSAAETVRLYSVR